MRLSDLLRAKGRETQDAAPVEQHAGDDGRIVMIEIASIRPNPYQPRREFAKEPLENLAQSIQEQGLLQPIVLRQAGAIYEVLMGERRLRACESLGWERIPAIVREVEDEAAAVVALVENLQREDLGLFEEIEGIRRLRDEFDLTQVEIARMLGLGQPTVANKLRLLQLGAEVRDVISREKLSERHARALLRLGSDEARLEALHIVVSNNLNVKQTEAWIQKKLEQDGISPRQKRHQEQESGMYQDARLFVTNLKQMVDQIAAAGTEVEMQQSEADGYVEVRVRIQTGKEF